MAFTQTRITTDADDFAPGVQTRVVVRTSLAVGDIVTLEIYSAGSDAEAGDTAGALFGTVSRAVDAGGVATFEYVTVPASRVRLRATGRGVCGDGSDEITIDVPAGAGCQVAVSPVPEVNPHYAPLGVLSMRSDPDPVAPGYQATVEVATRPGWIVELFRTAGAEQSLGLFTAGADGIARVPVSVADGLVAFRAVCRGAGVVLPSPALALVADTTPPSCELFAPAPGATITPASDEDHDLGDGLQIIVAGRTADADVAGEPAALVVAEPGRAAVAVPDGVVGDDGAVATRVTLIPSAGSVAFDVALTLRDHAGNACMSLASYDWRWQ